MEEIHFPERYTPGTTDNFVSNETFVKGLSAQQVWPFLHDTATWPGYYENVSDLSTPNGSRLNRGDRFSFATFGFPPLEAEVIECEPPGSGRAARLAWRAWMPDRTLDVVHAWLLEDLAGDRVRILTQESQLGPSAAELAAQRPNPMLNGHQAWLDGLIAAASR
ncbi:SRPBCC domain-containing protein [Nonomuraea monospora]|uniref:SRPBCC domain-containing protein n=1 Tax=Nonomuraea monospora TaxID=568818 RepID=A0ABN3CZ18_9ACTN